MSGDVVARGAISGTVTSSTGEPVADARVMAGGVAEIRTDTQGRFLLDEVPTGTQQVDVRSIGLTPAAVVVDVFARDTAGVALTVSKEQVLETVITKASAVRQRYVADFEARRSQGMGRFLDSTVTNRLNTMDALYQQFPSTLTQKGFLYLPGNGARGPCAANVMIDGREREQEDLQWLRPSDIAAVELYTRFMGTPSALQPRKRDSQCGTIVVWTKDAWP